MPSASRKRRAVSFNYHQTAPLHVPALNVSQPQVEPEQSDEGLEPSTQRGRGRMPVFDDESEEEEEEQEPDNSGAEMDTDDGVDSHHQVVKKLVRYALACEYQRMPIKRTGITEKILSVHCVPFKRTFDAAQHQLRTKFGMEMVELPGREKVTLKDRRLAQKNKGTSKPSPSYILTTVLPTEYRIPSIIPPSAVGGAASEEASYMALCTVIVSIIALNTGGQIPDHKLTRYLKRMNADENMPMDKTQAVMQKMQRQGYIVKITDRSGDEETTDWRVGPRGKVEIGNKGIQGLVNEVYGDSAPEDLQKRLHRSLGMEIRDLSQSGGAEE